MKRWLSASELNRLAADPKRKSHLPAAPVVDPAKPWIPERYTALWHAPIYASLHREHRLKYNQLCALRVNEYVMMLEDDLVERVLRPLVRRRDIAADPDLVAAIETMIDEERTHCAGFAALNHACRPDLYPPDASRIFMAPSPLFRIGLPLLEAVSGRFAFGLWYMMALEESSMTLSRAYVREPAAGDLGPIDPGFARVHVEHMKDESRHLHIDGLLIDKAINAARPWVRGIDAAIFRWAMSRVTRIGRRGSNARVVRRLIADMPELGDREDDMMRALESLNANAGFRESIFGRDAAPKTFAAFGTTPEMAAFAIRAEGHE